MIEAEIAEKRLDDIAQKVDVIMSEEGQLIIRPKDKYKYNGVRKIPQIVVHTAKASIKDRADIQPMQIREITMPEIATRFPIKKEKIFSKGVGDETIKAKRAQQRESAEMKKSVTERTFPGIEPFENTALQTPHRVNHICLKFRKSNFHEKVYLAHLINFQKLYLPRFFLQRNYGKFRRL